MAKILVTGAGGYIGSITCELLLKNDFSIVGIDNFSRGYKDPLIYLEKKYGSEKIKWEELDLFRDDLNRLFEKYQFDGVLHFAGLANVGESWEKPEIYFDNNVVASQRLAEAMIKAHVKNLVFSSSCAVYGDAQYVPIDENHPLAIPASPYGASKKMDEEIFSWYQKTGSLNYVFLRYFNVTGANDEASLGDSKKPSFHLIQNAVRGALGLGEFELNYTSVKTPDNSPIRDYVNVVDLARAHMLALNYLLNGGESNIFNLGTGEGNSVLEIIKIVKEKTGKDFKVGVAKNRRKGEADKMIADNKKAKEILGWKPEHSLDQSIESLVNWYKSHPKGWGK
jgi:UDP-glucose 4-epimerase